MHVSEVRYLADGVEMVGHFYRDEKWREPRPAVLIFPEALGPGDHEKEKAERLVALGYCALACDLHGNEKFYTDPAEARAVLEPVRADHRRLRDRAKGGFDVLCGCEGVDVGRIAAIGFCLGGTMALELARSGADLRAVVGFHSGLLNGVPDDFTALNCAFLICIGADDPGVPLAHRIAFEEEMRERGADWRMNIYGGVVHSFTNPKADGFGLAGVRYDARADNRSWAEMTDFFAETLSV